MSDPKCWRIKATRIEGVICFQIERMEFAFIGTQTLEIWEHYIDIPGPRTFRTQAVAEKALKDMLFARQQLDDISSIYYDEFGNKLS